MQLCADTAPAIDSQGETSTPSTGWEGKSPAPASRLTGSSDNKRAFKDRKSSFELDLSSPLTVGIGREVNIMSMDSSSGRGIKNRSIDSSASLTDGLKLQKENSGSLMMRTPTGSVR